MKTKNNSVQLSNSIAIASLVISVVTLVWIGGFRFSTLIHEVRDVNERVQKLENRMEDGFEKVDVQFDKVDKRFEKLENKIDNMEIEFHKMDVRVNTLERRKP